MTLEMATWDPYSDHYALNEEAMLDWERNMIDNRFRKKHMESNAMVYCVKVDNYEKLVDETILAMNAEKSNDANLRSDISSGAQYEIASFSKAISMKRDLDNLHSSIGSMSIKER